MLAAACTQSARELPPDLAPDTRLEPGDRNDPAYRLACPEVDAATAETRRARASLEARVANARVRNQAAVISSEIALVPPATVSADPHTYEHETIRVLDERLERLDRLRVAKRCGAR
jgi:hypothetical protein